MFKTAEFQIRQRRYQPNLTCDFGSYDYWRIIGLVLLTKSFSALTLSP